MFGHQRNFIYGYICGKLDKHIMTMKIDTSIDVDVYIPAKYFLPKKYIGKYLSPDIDVRLKACNRFKNRYRNLMQRINQHITNVFNPGIKITSVEIGFDGEVNLLVIQLRITWINNNKFEI